MSSKRRPSSTSPQKSPKKQKTTGTLDVFFRSKQPAQWQARRDEGQVHNLMNASSSKLPPSIGLSGETMAEAIIIEDEDAGPVLQSNEPSEIIKSIQGAPAVPYPARDTADISSQHGEVSGPGLSATATESLHQFPDLGGDPLTFDTSQSPWPSHKPAPYSFLAHVLDHLSQTKSRIILLNTLTNALRFLILYDPESIVPALYMVSNSISPSYVPAELAVGPKILSSALMSISGLTNAALRRLYNTHGDPGDVAYEAKASIRTLIPHPPLMLRGVYESLLKISRAKGNGAQKQKQSIVERLLLSAKGEEVRFIMRTLSQHLRVGAVRTTILTAFARAAVLSRPTGQTVHPGSPFLATSDELAAVLPLPDKKGKRKGAEVDRARITITAKMGKADALLRTIYVKHPNYDKIINEFLTGGLENLAEAVPLTVGIPLHPTLGSPTRSLEEIYERLGGLPFAAEYKYDGQRAQIHASVVSGGVEIKIFSRHLEDMTDKYPDIVILVKQYCQDSPVSEIKVTSFIIDSEIVAWDTKNGIIKSFQELSSRARKDVKLHQVSIPVCLFVFDLMYLNNESLLSTSFRERRRLLYEHFPPREMTAALGGARLRHVTSLDSDCPGGRKEVETFWEVAVESQCEGLMIKLLDSGDVLESSEGGSPSKPSQVRKKPLPATYEPDKRTSAWLKLKKDYVKGVGDTLDLVPIGAWHGNGRKAQWWSPILLAVWDERLGLLVAVCKCMSGFTDEFYKALSERYPENSATCSKEPLGDYDVGGLKPSVYFEPREVWEVACAEITISPVSIAALGQVSETRGLSVRFPRFVRVREDKRVEDATRSIQLAELWRKRDGNGRPAIAAQRDDGGLIEADLEESEIEEEMEDDNEL